MKKHIFFIIILTISSYCIAQERFGFDINKNSNLPIREIRTLTKSELNKLNNFLDSILKVDQYNRKHNQDNLGYTDSSNFYAYSNLINNIGYITTDINKYWLPIYGINRVKHINNNENSKKTMPLAKRNNKRYVLHLHFSDRYGLLLMNEIEKSILKDSTCNEEDLMDYFTTYLFRKTEFRTNNIFGCHFSMFLLPDLSKGYFAKYYRYSLNKYLQYAFKKYPDIFRCIVFDKLFISKDNKFNWSEIRTSPMLNDLKIVKYLRDGDLSSSLRIIERYLLFWHSDIDKDCYYSIVFCKHEGIRQPSYGD